MKFEARPDDAGLGTSEESLPRTIENKELGITYTESIEELPPEMQESTGVKRLRRRKVSQSPSFFNEHPFNFNISEYSLKDLGISSGEPPTQQEIKTQVKVKELWHFLTNGRFPSYKTWTHALCGDWVQTLEGKKMIYDFYQEESKPSHASLFQEVFPERNIKIGVGIQPDLYEGKGGKIKRLSDEKFDSLSIDDIRKSLSVFNLSVGERGNAWSSKNTPVFVFGRENNLFVDYLETITKDTQIREMLELSGWKLSIPKKLDEDNRPYIDESRDINSLDYLLDETDVHYKFGASPNFPIVRHPSLKPFRFSYAEMVILQKKDGLEIVFFETYKCSLDIRNIPL